MEHPDEGRLRALLDDELAQADANELRGHIEGCAVCDVAVRRVEETQVLATALLDALDVAAPTERVRAHIAARRSEAARTQQASRFLGLGRRELARAALMVLGFSGAVAAAVHPASPVRRLLLPEPEPLVIAPTPETPAPAIAAAPVAEVGVRLAVPSTGVRVALAGLVPGSSIELAWVEESSASVYAPEGTSFTTAEALGRIEAQVTGGMVRIELPRQAARASLVVNGVSYLEKTGERIDFPGAPALVEGSRVSFQVR